MLNKTWILLLGVLALTASAHGTLVDVVMDSYDDNDLSGTITPGDEVHIKIVSSVYISTIDFGLDVTGNGTLAEKGSAPQDLMQHHANFLWGQSDPLIVGNEIETMSGVSFIDIPPADLIWNLKVICGDPGPIQVDLHINNISQYKNDPGDPTYSILTDDDLGDLTIEVVQAPPGKELTTEVIGGHGTVDPGQGSFPEGMEVPLTAIPDTGYRVKQWIGTDNNRSLLNTNTVTMTTDKTVKVKFEPTPLDEVTKALFKAGKTRAAQQDSFLILGTLSAGQQDVIDADEVSVRVGTAIDPGLFSESFMANDENFNLLGHQAGFHFKGADGGIKKLDVNVKSGKFVLMASGLDLSGLSSPVLLELSFGSYINIFTIEEDILNNRNKSIPTQYLVGMEDMLRVDKSNVRTNQNSGLVRVTVQGAITVDEQNLDLSAPGATITVIWGDFNETIPAVAGAITAKNSKFTYKRPRDAADTHFVISAVFNMQKGTFKVVIKKVGLDNTGTTNFGLQLDGGAGIVFDELVGITL